MHVRSDLFKTQIQQYSPLSRLLQMFVVFSEENVLAVMIMILKPHKDMLETS